MIRAVLICVFFWAALAMVALDQLLAAIVFGMVSVVFLAWLLEG